MERILIGGTCEVTIGRGRLGNEAVLPDRAGRSRVALFTQPGAETIARRVADAERGVEVAVKVLPDRDAAKTWEVTAEAHAWLGEIGLNRHDTIVAVGGGAVTDAAGFIAATYLRGVESIAVPTTLLGAVDAAIGGKTGINVGGKNLVGAFYHPARVVIDLDVLEALPVELRREGMAETIKAGLIGDPVLFSAIERYGLAVPLDEAVPRAVAVKAGVVNEDFQERGRRAILNYGHTVGHAIETNTGMPHGHAIAIGMVAAGWIATRLLDFREADRQEKAIVELGLPVRVEGLGRAEVLDALFRDKKRDAAGVNMVLLRSIGQPELLPVGVDLLDEALERVGVG